MAEKHSKIYTRRGDDGSTGLANGQRVAKDSARMEAIGAVDELNSQIGVLAAMDIPSELAALLLKIQQRLFDLGGTLALPNRSLLGDDAVTELEAEIDRLDAELPTLKRFILPGGSLAAAHCHNARSVCRRAERQAVSLQPTAGDDSNQIPVRYLNRLSDLLFVLARTLSRLNGGEEIFWHN